MSGNFWTSSHYKEWSTAVSLLPPEVEYCCIFQIFTLSRKLKAKQPTLSHAIIFFKRFYSQNHLEFDPTLVVLTCLYLASKVTESPISAALIRETFTSFIKKERIEGISNEEYVVDQIYEFEFHLIGEMKHSLIVYHPFISLAEHIKLFGLDDKEGGICWGMLNDFYYIDASMQYPPHVLSLSCVFICFSLTGKLMPDINVDFEDVSICAQAMLEMYSKWDEREINRT